MKNCVSLAAFLSVGIVLGAPLWAMEGDGSENTYKKGITRKTPDSLPEDKKDLMQARKLLGETVLGVRYYEGEGVEVDYAKAISWHRKAAAQRHANAQIWIDEIMKQRD